MEDCWDLQAIVRGTATGGCCDGAMMMGYQQDYYPSSFTSFSDVSATSWGTPVVLDELEQVYRPFYPSQLPVFCTNNSVSSSSLSVGESARSATPNGAVATASSSPSATNPVRKRKNQQKKAVHQVITSEGPTSDKWAWRKYGQKPIKGSPHPRSYYRCSSSKGCLARKQVERSRSDPSQFIITYSAEHDHPYPTRRSTLAGSTRKKSSTIKTLQNSTDKSRTTTDTQTAAIEDSSCSQNSNGTPLSPTTPLMTSVEDEGSKEEEENVEDSDANNDMDHIGSLLSDDFGMGLGLDNKRHNWFDADLAFDDGFLSFDDFSENFSLY